MELGPAIAVVALSSGFTEVPKAVDAVIPVEAFGAGLMEELRGLVNVLLSCSVPTKLGPDVVPETDVKSLFKV